MIAPGQSLPLRVTTHACANGETVELRLMVGDERIGEPMWVNGKITKMEDVLPNLLARLLANADGRHLDHLRGGESFGSIVEQALGDGRA